MLIPRHSPEDREISLPELWHILRRNWAWILGVTVLGAAAALAFNRRAVPLYEAAVSIRVNEERSEIPQLLEALGTAGVASEIGTEMEVLRSRSLAEHVVDTLFLKVRLVSPSRLSRSELLDRIFVERWAPPDSYVFDRIETGTFTIRGDASGESYGAVAIGEAVVVPGATFRLRERAGDFERLVIAVDEFGGAVGRLRGGVSVSRPNRDASIIQVAFTSPDTQLVHAVPNTLTTLFISRGQASRKTRAVSTVTFLEEQIDTLSRQLAAAEDTLTAFRQGEQVVSLRAEADAQVTQLARLQAERNTIEAERAALRQLVTEIESEAQSSDPTAPSPFTRLISFPSLFRNASASELLRTLNQANAERAELLRRRTLQDPDVRSLTQRIRDIEAQLQSTARTYLQGLNNQVGAYDQTLATFGSELGRIPAKELRLARLERQADALEEIFMLLQNRLQEARIARAIEDPTIRTIDPAVSPRGPVSPRPTFNLLVGLIFGSIIGCVGALARELVDETVHTPEDLQTAMGGAPVLGLIPAIAGTTRNRQNGSSGASPIAAQVLVAHEPNHPVAEAFRNLRTNLTFASPDAPVRVIVVTSPMPQDGKTTAMANLGITLAQQGIRVVLVDADLRRGTLHALLGAHQGPGLTSVLSGASTVEEAMQEVNVAGRARLNLLSTGPHPPNPAEVLASKRMQSLIEALETNYDIVLLDSPPLTAVTDAAVLGAKVDGVIMIARANFTERGAITYSAKQLDNVRANVLGGVLNGVDAKRDSRYASIYGRYGLYHSYYHSTNGKSQQEDPVEEAQAPVRKG